MTAPTDGGLSPVEALQRIDAILRDRRMTLAERVATVGVVLRAGRRNATAFPGFRFLRQQYRLGSTAIGRALAVPDGLALGVHLEPDGHGPRGVQRFRVLPVQDDDPPDASAPVAGALDNTGSAPTAGALQDSQRTQSEPPAHPNEDASAPNSGVQRTRSGSETNVVTSARELERENCAADAATDSLSLAAARSGENNGDNGNNQNGNGAAGGTTTTKAARTADADRVLTYAFPSSKPNEKALAACQDRIAEALRLGATPQLLAWAVQSKKAKGKKPWDRIQEAGEMTAALLARARRCWPACQFGSLAELLAAVSENYVPRNEKERGLIPDVQAYRQQATQWPPDGRDVAAPG